MANARITLVKNSVFIFVIFSVSKLIIASKEDAYTIQASSKFEDISVIALENGRHRRQVPSTGNGDTSTTTQAPAVPTTSHDITEDNIMHDDHSYYQSFMFNSQLDQYWVALDPSQDSHNTLSNSHRTAVTAKLPFQFPFYGHPIVNVTIATGGFIYMSPFIHKFLTATQYIAPLMANFDTKTGGKNSRVLYRKVDKKFVVEWRGVHLQDQNGTGTFHFQVILHMNGSINFVYKTLPIPIVNISSSSHPVKIGLSDAFYFDTTQFGTKRRTIYEYHRVVLNTTEIREGTVVVLHPQPTCNKYSDCETCVSSKISFDCRWCGIINKCSDSVDWHRQEWLNAGCVHLSRSMIDECVPVNLTTMEPTSRNPTTARQNTEPSLSRVRRTPTTSTQVNPPSTKSPSVTPEVTTAAKPDTQTTDSQTTAMFPKSSSAYKTNPCGRRWSGAGNCSQIPTRAPHTTKKEDSITTTKSFVYEKFYDKTEPGGLEQQKDVGTKVAIIVIVVVLVVVLVGAVGGWVYYAYTHPTSASGMWLMEHRPSQMKAKMASMKFWKSNGSAGDKYAVESNA